MSMLNRFFRFVRLALLLLVTGLTQATPLVSRLTPPSELFSTGRDYPMIARFLSDQRFDLQATVQPDPGQTITRFEFAVDGVPILVPAARTSLVTQGLVKGMPRDTAVVSLRAYSNNQPGKHILSVTATQSDGKQARAKGSFEVVPLLTGDGRPARNVILLLGDGMGITHRTAARIVAKGYSQGKANQPLAMDTFPYTGLLMTSSLNSIVTDSAPGMSNYVTGNKAANAQEGVWPDETLDAFDNPRVEYLSEYLHRKFGKALGIVTTADVSDATPAANAVHTANRSAGTGIVDQFLDDRELTGLTVLMGGGRKWFLPNRDDSINPQPVNGSQRLSGSDAILPDDVVAGWGVAKGDRDAGRDLIADFQRAGFGYAPDAASMTAVAARSGKLLGLFSYGNMNVAYDKIAGRRGAGQVVNDFGFPDQPMLDEMARAALTVLAKQPNGFYMMIEGASIDKQAHAMDSDRWILETLEFDRAVEVAQNFARQHTDTLVLVTADHETAGASIIGSANSSDHAYDGTATSKDRDQIVHVYDSAGFPQYQIMPDGYPQTTDIANKILIGYGSNADRRETWRSNEKPVMDDQPFAAHVPLNTYPANAGARNQGQGFSITGQIGGHSASHTATDIPLSAFGRGSRLFTGVFDNTEVFFKIGQAVTGGASPLQND
ncbi:alkaline phosphatase [Herbaspirillum lusitanum]|uniref:alkaline phosphatase n=1 Tax=Herbaspirillum lusitanum TaxID=213312 RepID=UPI00223705FA|nr:alkaline phosphatase [Herbaspirillum lusitanum]